MAGSLGFARDEGKERVKILLIQLRRLGDLILTTPAIAALRQNFPKAEITLAVTRENAPLLPAIAGVDQFFLTRRGLRDFSTWRAIRRARFDCVIDFTRNDRSAWLTFLSSAPRRIVSDRIKHKSKLRARFYNEFVDCAMKQMHTIDYNLALLGTLAVSDRPRAPHLELPRGAWKRADEIIANEICAKPFAIFHPGSARREKFWEPARWAEAMAFASQELELVPVLSAGRSQIEMAHVAEIRAQFKAPCVDLSGRLDLLTLAALIARARLLLTVDSAPMHLAHAMKTPQIVLFGPTNPFHWRPRESPAIVLFGEKREPLTSFQAPEIKRPMNQISTAAVIDAMRAMLSAPAASAV